MNYFTFSVMAAVPKPTSMTRAKEWSPEAEEAWRFQVAGYRDEHEYKNVKKNEVRSMTSCFGVFLLFFFL